MASRFNVDAVFRAIDKFSAPVVKMEKKMKIFTRNIERGLRRASARAGKFLGGLKRMAKGFLVAGAAAGYAAARVLRAGAEFEQAITNVGAVGLKTRDEIQALENQAKFLGETTKFTATEAATAMEILARAGFSVNETMAATPAVLDAAAASGLEMAEVADVMSNVLKGMGLEMDQASRVSDVLALASSKTNSTIGSLGESMKNVAATARQLKIPLEDAVASVALLQDVGLDASVAGSAMNTMLTRLAKPPASLAKQMRRLKLSFKDAEGNMKSFPEVLEVIRTLADRSGGSLNQVGVLAELTGLRGQKAALQLAKLIDPKNNRLKELTEQLEHAQGAAAKMAKIRMDTLTGDITILGSTLEGLKIDIFDEAQAPLRGIVQSITEWVRQNKQLIVGGVTSFLTFLRENGPLIVNILGRVARVVGVFSVLAVGIKVATAAMIGFNIVMAANPIGLVIAALGVLAFFWEDLVGIFSEAKLIVSDLWQTIVDGVTRVMPVLRPLLEAVGALGGFALNPIGGIMDMLGLGGDDDGVSNPGRLPPQTAAPQVAAPGGRTEMVTREDINILLRDPAGRAEVSSTRPRSRSKLRVASSGAE